MSADRGQIESPEDEGPVDTRLTIFALVAGWACPGAGHLLLGRRRRALIFGLLIWSSFTLGMMHSGRLALRDPAQPILTSLQVVANIGIGPADLIARKLVYGGFIYSLPRSGKGELDPRETLRVRARSSVAIYGTAYIWTAGLMNLLLLFDIWDIARGRKA
jgi:hypothetical protein